MLRMDWKGLHAQLVKLLGRQGFTADVEVDRFGPRAPHTRSHQKLLLTHFTPLTVKIIWSC